MNPKFQELASAFENGALEIRRNVDGCEPEQVLVLEIVGEIDNFPKAVSRISGLECLGDFQKEDIYPDVSFVEEGDARECIRGRLFLVMTNQRALEELLSLWRRFNTDDEINFPRGLSPLQKMFSQLNDVHRWGVKERLLETGIIEAWEEDVSYDPERKVYCEIELWYRKAESFRCASENKISKLIRDLQGEILRTTSIPEIAYHGILASIPAQAAGSICMEHDTELVKCDQIMFFHPVGQICTGKGTSRESPTFEGPEYGTVRHRTSPVVALFDGLPLQNHRALSGRLFVDDPDNFAERYDVQNRLHGTTMASLILYGDLKEEEPALEDPLYVRPIMVPDEAAPHGSLCERLPQNEFFVDILHRSVKRIFEGEDDGEGVAPSVRVINLSIGDPSRPYSLSMSPAARMLDWLSVKYNVLFIVSAGNQKEPLSLGIGKRQFEELDVASQQEIVYKAILRNERTRKLLSPAESMNSLTIGAVHFDWGEEGSSPSGDFNSFPLKAPSPFTSFGGGYRRSVKPDFVMPGGRVIYREILNPIMMDSLSLEPVCPPLHSRPPGMAVAVPSAREGEINKIAFTCGTSNAAARASHMAGRYYAVLKEILHEQCGDIDTRPFETQVLKAMMVHSCSPRMDDEGIVDRIVSENDDKNHLLRKWIGYGVPDETKMLNCTDQRATIIGFGKLRDREAHKFILPIPQLLESNVLWRRLTVTLAWLSPIAPTTQKYRAASLWFKVLGDRIASDRCGSSRGQNGWQAVMRGTVQHEVFEGENAEVFDQGGNVEIYVNCRHDAVPFDGDISYGLVVSFEISEGVDLPVYNEIAEKINVPLRIRTA